MGEFPCLEPHNWTAGRTHGGTEWEYNRGFNNLQPEDEKGNDHNPGHARARAIASSRVLKKKNRVAKGHTTDRQRFWDKATRLIKLVSP